MLASDIDAVLLCHSDPKTEAVIASVDAGKHAFVEKPICFSLEEADAIIEASARSGKVVQAGYTKLFEPAYELARSKRSPGSTMSGSSRSTTCTRTTTCT